MPALDSCLVSKAPFPSFMRESRDENGKPTFVSGLERTKLIADMPVVCVDTKEETKLRDLEPLYSQRWREAMQH